MMQRSLAIRGMQTPTAEEDFEAWIREHPEHFLERPTRLDELLIYLNRATARTEDLLTRAITALEAIAAAGGVTVPGVTVPTVITAIVLTPEAIADFIQVGAPKGQILVQGFSVPIGCLAGATTTWNYVLPEGWVSITRTPYELTSDFYDPNLIADFRLEADQRQLAWLPMDGPKRVAMQFIVKHYGMSLIITNNTATNAVVTVAGSAIWLEQGYFEEFYLPLIQMLYNAGVEVAK